MNSHTLPSPQPGKPLANDDLVFTRATSLDGRINRNIPLTGCTTVQEVINSVRRALADCLGLIRLEIRNTSRGWTLNQNILLTHRLPEGTQLSLAI